jgi:hypothetical protein
VKSNPLPIDILFQKTRSDIIGGPSYAASSNLGVVQFKHPYDEELIDSIRTKAELLRHSVAEKRHLNLKYIRAAHLYIPEICEIVNYPNRLQILSELANDDLEVYPVSVISSIVTFQDGQDEGSVMWHTDGVPVTEMIPLSIQNLHGGKLEVYSGYSEVGMAEHYTAGHSIKESDKLQIEHRMGYSTLAQFIRIMHRAEPIKQGSRITLNVNLRSKNRPFIDDNNLCYLGADNPGFEWQEEYINDVKKQFYQHI